MIVRLSMILIGVLFARTGYSQTVAFPRRDLVKVEVTTRVDMASTTVFVYSLTVRSLPESKQEVWDMGFDVPVPTQQYKAKVIYSSTGRKMFWSSSNTSHLSTAPPRPRLRG